LQDIVGEHCSLTIKADEAGWVKVDQGHVEQILVNLVKNAREASSTDGQVELRLSRINRLEAQKLGSPLEASWQVMLEVADYGHGMSAEVKGRLYDPFFTTKAPGQGTGLGLSAVHGLVTQNGGAIFFESEINRGTTARIFFAEVGSGQRHVSVEAKSGSTHAGRSILIVDDDPTACRTAVFALEGAGYEVTVVDSGFKAVKFFRQSADEIHLVIASVILPVLAGRELGERLRKLQPGVPLLYVCGAFDLPIGWTVDDPTHPLLIKPFRADDLVKRVASLVETTKT
jgi:CheY-like chemotaxis protein